MLTEKRQEQTN